MSNEDSLVGVNSMSDRFFSVFPNQASLFSLDFELTKHMRNCDNKVTKITPCIKDFYDKEYGKGFENIHAKLNGELYTKYGGYENVINKTGCYKPCQETKYEFQEFITYNIRHSLDLNVQQFLSKYDVGAKIPGIVIRHEKRRKIILNEEVYEYGMIRVISEVGGIIGIFVGLSFLSIFTDIVIPIVVKITKHL